MIIRSRLGILLICAIVTGCAVTALAYQTLSGPVSVTSQGTIPLTPGAILDDFNGGLSINKWGLATSTFSSSATVPAPDNARCIAAYTNDPAIAYGGTGYSLQLAYNVTASTATYAGYSTGMGGVGIGSYKAVSFMVKGANGGEFLKVQLKNSSTGQYWDAGNATHYYRNYASVYVTDYLAGSITTAWQKVTIPLDAFANLDGITSMKEMVFVFENSQSTTNGSPKQGTVYIDNIQFETAAPASVKISSFGHKVGVNALGGTIGDISPTGAVYPVNPSAQHTISATNYTSAPYSMLSEYTVSPGWAGHVFIFGGGNADDSIGAIEHSERMGWIAISHNFSAFTYLKFNVIAESATQNPATIKIELVDNAGNKATYVSGITTSWLACQLPLSGFTGLDTTTIKQMNIIYEDSQAYSRVGGIYIDDIRFE